ncbi:DNA primase [Helicobacter heilmannii]|uniref:DNA primase n=1 Tax=Helicobacter heilmannii TaxID=35817 RepID=UPI0006A1721F|nr:DNA primase [Helicobacter heilmannii]CRF47796.1 DNA primase [Helicobacter heilmannii]
MGKVVLNLRDLRESLDIVEVIGHFIELKRIGFMYKAKCPFHTERTASFMVHPHKRFFYCFGCQASGDAIGFVRQYEGVEFIEAVELVARLSNFNLEYGFNARVEPLKQALEALKTLSELASFELLDSPQGAGPLEYLHQRGLNTPLMRDFKLGFCSLGVVEKMRQSFSVDTLALAGILNDKGKFSMLYRILIPVHNTRGDVVGFGGRYPSNIVPQPYARYLISRNTELFKKSNILYNLHKAMPHILEKQQVIVCEGFFDVMAFAHFGYLNAVCSMGVAFSEVHLKILMKLGVEIIFAFDNDVAGHKAAINGLDMCFRVGYGSCALVRFKANSVHSRAKDLDRFLKSNTKPEFTKNDGWTYFCGYHMRPELTLVQRDQGYAFLESLIASYPPFLKSAFLSKLRSFLPLQSDEPKKTYANSSKTPDSRYSLEGRILCTMLESEEFRFISYRNLSTEDFVLKEVFLGILSGSLDVHQREALKDRFIPIESKYWQVCLRRFKMEGLKQSMRVAMDAKDFKMLWLLDQKLASVKQGI